MSDLDAVRAEVSNCTRCPLAQTRTKTVPGEGSPTAEILFIGEGPGFHEDKQGKPFVGAAGNLLNELLSSIGLGRDSVFITNIVKCRPPGNRDPLPGEVEACSGYLERQIAAIDPKVIVTLGRHSLAKFLPGVTISRVHGQPVERNGRTILPLYHPAAALHQQALRPVLFEDVKKLPGLVAAAQQKAAPAPAAEAARQLSMF